MLTRRFAPWPPIAVSFIVALFVSLLAAAPALASKVFLPTSGSWHDASSWSDGVVPGPADDVYIGPGKTVFVSGPTAARNLTVDSAAIIRVASPGAVALHGPTHTLHGTVHLNAPGGPITPGAELRFAASAEIAGVGSVIMNQVGPGARIVVDVGALLHNRVVFSGIGQLRGRIENHGTIRATGAALSLDNADIFNVRLIEAVGPTAFVSIFDNELVQDVTGRMRTAAGGRFAITISVIRGGTLDSDGSPSAEFGSSSTSPLRTTLEDVFVAEPVRFHVFSHSITELRRGRFAGRLVADSPSDTRLSGVFIDPAAVLTFSPICVIDLTDVDLAGSAGIGAGSTVRMTRTTVGAGGSCSGLDSDVYLSGVECRGQVLWDSCRVYATGLVDVCGPDAAFTITGDAPASVLECDPGTQFVARDDARIDLEECSASLRGTWTNQDGGQTRMEQCAVESEDGYQWFATRRGHLRYINSSLTGESQYWTITEDGKLTVHATTIAAALGVDEKDLEFDVQNATFESLNAFLRAKGLICSGTNATFDLISTSVDALDGSFTFVNSAVNAHTLVAPSIDVEVSGQYGVGLLDGTASSVRSITVNDQARVSVRGGWYLDDFAVDAFSAAEIDGVVSWRGTVKWDADPDNILFGPGAAMFAAGGEAGVTHLYGWLPNEGPATSHPAGRMPYLNVAPFTTLVLQPNEGRAVYVFDTVLDANAVLNNHNCAPVYIETVQADPTAEVINCSTTTPDREQIARDFQALGDALEEELPLADMTGPNDQANANRRAQLAQKLRLIAASIRAEEDEEAATQIADVIKKVDPEQDPKWLRDTEATNLVLLTLTLLEGQFQALGE